MERSFLLADYSDRSLRDRNILRDEAAESNMRRFMLDELRIPHRLFFIGRNIWKDEQSRLAHVLRPSEVGGPGVLEGYSLVSSPIQGLSADYRRTKDGQRILLRKLSFCDFSTALTAQFIWHSPTPRIKVFDSGVIQRFDPASTGRLNLVRDVQEHGAAALVNSSVQYMFEPRSAFHPDAYEFNPNQADAGSELSKGLHRLCQQRKESGMFPDQMANLIGNLVDVLDGFEAQERFGPADIRQGVSKIRGYTPFWNKPARWLFGEDNTPISIPTKNLR